MASRTDVGRKRSNNQDYLGDFVLGGVGNGNGTPRKLNSQEADERGYLFAVADGMGGYAGGEVASELTVLTIFDAYYNHPSSGDIGADLSKIVRLANDAVHREAQSSGRLQMGTTLTMALVKGNKAIFGNVGDSRTYLIRQGIAERVTHDHSMIQEQIDAGYLTPEQAEKSNFRNLITRAIGHRPDVESDLFERELQVGDVLLLCSDGLHGLVKEIEIGTLVATEPNLQTAADQLVQMANERGGPDNITVLMVRVVELGEPLPPLLNGREPVYNKENIYSQKTSPVPASFESRPTIPNISVVTPTPVKPQQEQATKPMPIPALTNQEEKKPGGSGLIVGVIGLLVVIAIVVAFVIFSGGNNNAGATPTPAVTQPGAELTPVPTVTVNNTVTGLPTVTPDPNRPPPPGPGQPNPQPTRAGQPLIPDPNRPGQPMQPLPTVTPS